MRPRLGQSLDRRAKGQQQIGLLGARLWAGLWLGACSSLSLAVKRTRLRMPSGTKYKRPSNLKIFGERRTEQTKIDCWVGSADQRYYLTRVEKP
jgi:hypothetical protein